MVSTALCCWIRLCTQVRQTLGDLWGSYSVVYVVLTVISENSCNFPGPQRPLSALCLRGSRSWGTGGGAHFSFPSAYCLLQRWYERFRVPRIFPSLFPSLTLVKTQFFYHQNFCDQGDWIVLTSYQCADIGFLKPPNRERNWILVCVQKLQWKCYDFSLLRIQLKEILFEWNSNVAML